MRSPNPFAGRAGVIILITFLASCSTAPTANNPYLPNRDGVQAQNPNQGETRRQRRQRAQQEELSPILQAANAHIELAMNHVSRSDFDAALEQLEKSSNLAARNPELQHAYGIYHRALGENQRANAYFLQAIRQDPDNSRYNNNYGVSLSEAGKYDEALERFALAFADEDYVNRASAYENYADVLVEQGRFAESLEFYESALALNPEWFIIESKIANALYNQGAFAQAYTRFDNYMDIIAQINVQPSDQDLELGIAIAASIRDYDRVQAYRELQQERIEASP